MSWQGVGEAYADSYAALCAGTGESLRALAGEAGGRSLLDVGSGDGTLAAEWASVGWQVTACEPEPSMRAVSAKRHPGVPVGDGALPHLPFDDDAFDAVAANFVLNHLADPRAGAAELQRVSRGIVVASIWTQSSTRIWADVTQRAGLAPASGGLLPKEKDFDRTVTGFERMLRDASWRPEVIELTWTWRPEPRTLWRSVDGGVAGVGSFFRGLPDADRRRFRVAFDEVVAERAEDGRVPLTQTAAIAVDRTH
ncbi:methyltransferase domain-containing protein [Microbacterium sp.]|uniref:class I SAM-dependent methyltransferase n=1 Tax=Microbacterium sp. TaxID=51671 RepID=UPI0028127020|nr:methyltransferase domain-containing protein [Microbacterium sp.]